MIHATRTVNRLVSETFTRTIRDGKSTVDRECVRLKPGMARTLALSRFVQLEDTEECKEQKDDKRRLTAVGVKNGSVIAAPRLDSWRTFTLVLTGPEGDQSNRLLFARQKSRLMVGMAGGVFENGGLTLDRISGLPIIPGSAVKGCARRFALAALQEWTSGQLHQGVLSNPLVLGITGFEDPLAMLVDIALLFGWSNADWFARCDFETDKDWEKKRSDFAWACGDQWETLRAKVAAELLARLGLTVPTEHAGTPWNDLPSFAGTIAFLPAHPWDDDPGIELDVLTCHHKKYYNAEKEFEHAPDTEEPLPVIFPALAPGCTWVFLLHPTDRASATHLACARRWLGHGLDIFGIGAKTNVGYGWFMTVKGPQDVAPDATESVLPPLPESETFLNAWGNKKLNGFSAKAFAQKAAIIKNDAELLLVLQALAPDHINRFTQRDPFWTPFLQVPAGKELLGRLKNMLPGQ